MPNKTDDLSNEFKTAFKVVIGRDCASDDEAQHFAGLFEELRREFEERRKLDEVARAAGLNPATLPNPSARR